MDCPGLSCTCLCSFGRIGELPILSQGHPYSTAHADNYCLIPSIPLTHTLHVKGQFNSNYVGGGINHHLELAITYKKMGRKDLAEAAYSEVLELPIRDTDDDDHKKEDEERLKKMG